MQLDPEEDRHQGAAPGVAGGGPVRILPATAGDVPGLALEAGSTNTIERHGVAIPGVRYRKLLC